jgi:hypothetical protein
VRSACAIAFGVVLGALSRWAATLSPRHGRLVLAALVVGPMAMGDSLGNVPGVVSSFGWLIDRIAAVGGAIT